MRYGTIKLGQVWRLDVYSSGLMDNEFRGVIYYLVTGKQSMGQWKLTRIASEPRDLRVGYDRYANFWIKGAEIRSDMTQVEDVEQFKAAIVLYG